MTNPTAGPAADLRFPSFLALREAHAALLEREDDHAPEWQTAIVNFIERGQATGALLDADSERRAAQSLLSYWTTQLYRQGVTLRPVSLASFDPDLAPALPDEPRPYLGLDAFSEADHGLFFGREGLVAELVQQLAAHRLLALLGASGSGKSSIVRAGLISALKAGALPGSEHWRYVRPLVPGSDPQRALEHALQSVAGGDPTQPLVLVVDQFEEIFTLSDRPAAEAFADQLIALAQAADAPHRLLLTLRSDYEGQLATLPELQAELEAATFRVRPLSAGELRRAIEEPARKVGLRYEEGVVDDLLTDLLGEPAALPLLQFTLLQLWEHRQRNRVTRAAYRELGGGRQALQIAADRFFAERLLPEEREVARRIFLRLVRPGEGLEVTSQRLRRRELFSRAYNAEITERVLEKLIAEARLLRQTDGDTPADAQVEVAHEALVRNWPTLVGWLEDERENVRRRNRVRDQARRWLAEAQDPNLLWRGRDLEAAEQLTDLSAEESGFVAASRAAVERAAAEKEAARQLELEANRRIAEVERQRAEEQARAARQLRQRLTLSLLLLSITFFALAGVAYFAVQARRNAQVADQNAQVANQNLQVANQNLQVAKQNAQTAQQSQATAVVASTQAVDQKSKAELAAATAIAAQGNIQQALSRQLAAQARTYLSQDLNTALLLAVEAYSVTTTPDATSVLNQAIQQASAQRVEYVDTTLPNAAARQQRILSLRFDAAGSHLVWAGSRGLLTTWALTATNQPLLAQPGPPSIEAVALQSALFLNAQQAAFSRDNGELFVYDLAARKITLTLEKANADAALNPAPTTSLALSPDGATLAAGRTDTQIVLWDWAAARQKSILRSERLSLVAALAFSPDGHQLAAGGPRKPEAAPAWVKVFDLVSGSAVVSLKGIRDSVTALAWLRDSTMLLSGGVDGAVTLWGLDTAVHPATARTLAEVEPPGPDAVTALAVNPDQSVLVVGHQSGWIAVYDMKEPAQPALIARLRPHTAAMDAMAFGPDGRLLAYGDWDGFATLLRIEPQRASSNLGLVQQACQLAKSNLSQAEWDTHFPGQAYHRTCTNLP